LEAGACGEASGWRWLSRCSGVPHYSSPPPWHRPTNRRPKHLQARSPMDQPRTAMGKDGATFFQLPGLGMRGAPLGKPSPAIDGAGSGPDGFGVDRAETLDTYVVEVMCRVRAGAHVAVAEKANRIDPDGRGSRRGMVRGMKCSRPWSASGANGGRNANIVAGRGHNGRCPAAFNPRVVGSSPTGPTTFPLVSALSVTRWRSTRAPLGLR
jgi:hypothetical protein